MLCESFRKFVHWWLFVWARGEITFCITLGGKLGSSSSQLGNYFPVRFGKVWPKNNDPLTWHNDTLRRSKSRRSFGEKKKITFATKVWFKWRFSFLPARGDKTSSVNLKWPRDTISWCVTFWMCKENWGPPVKFTPLWYDEIGWGFFGSYMPSPEIKMTTSFRATPKARGATSTYKESAQSR